ncbi:von Willebrand factor type A domain-containing protein [Glycomyces sp. NRRL B-16210]|uniref:vWA domain-containing protein n=1 Tax=Glycomyces sp. NRRL B-16210 TaxID=1463821 RepID=UPI00054D3D11|nr:von Willebrand factor type A domain-containing protein [Glycomyces sp. NRRL B-16210]
MRRLLQATIPVAVLLLPLAACSDNGETGASAEAGDYGQAEPAPLQDQDGEAYAFNEPTSPADDPESTFAVDVDTASYDYARRAIGEGSLPPADQVRPEEFVNYFDQGYAEPEGNGFAVSVDGAELPEWYDSGDATHIMRVGLQTRTVPDSERSDVNLTFVIDVSGSMSGERIQIVRDSLHTLVDRLRPTDSVAIVTYETDSEVLKGMTDVGDGEDLHAAIDDLSARGSTNMQAGLEDGYELAAEAFETGKDNRVILLSDGAANVGLTEHDAMLDRLEGHIADGITLLTVGVGDSYNQALLEQLADNGNGWAVYFATEKEAQRVFGDRLTSTLGVTARDAKIQVTFSADTVAEYRLIGFENRAIADEDFENDSVDGGEVGPGHSVTALYALSLTGEAGELAQVDVRWQDPETGEIDTASGEFEAGAFGESALPSLQVDMVAAAFAEVLRGSAAGFDCAAILPAAQSVAEDSDDPDVQELAELVAWASDLGA